MDDVKHERKVHPDYHALFEPRIDPQTNAAMPRVFVQYGNPAVEVIPGCLYLAASFEGKKEEPTDNNEATRRKRRTSSRKSVRQEEEEKGKEEEKEEGGPVELCIHIPAGMTVAEVYEFLAAFERAILYAQVLALVDEPDFYMMALQLRSREDALSLQRDCHLQPFNSVEESVCRVTPLSVAEFRSGQAVLRFPISKAEEVCAVCLEPVEGGMITTLCNHVFHFACLSKWADSTCPVCRYAMQPNANSACHVCGESSPQASLWMCLVCGHVGCGRNDKGHAKEHFEAFNHSCALEVTTQRVWDYSSDQYVHRIAQNGKDGKLVALGRKDQFEEVDAGIKLEQLLVEYNYLLSSELDKQMAFFQAQMSFKQAELRKLQEPDAMRDEELSRLVLLLQKRAQSLEKALVNGDTQLVELARRKEAAREKDAKLRSLNTRLLSQQSKTREGFEDRHSARQQEQEKELKSLDDQQRQLEEELNDLKFYLKTKKQIGNSPFRDELASAHVIVMGGDPKKKPKQRGKH